MTLTNKSVSALASLLFSIVASFAGCGCQPDLTVIHDDAPLRLATPTQADVFYDAGAPATTGHPHVENWVRAPNKVVLPAGKYVITRNQVPATTPMPAAN